MSSKALGRGNILNVTATGNITNNAVKVVGALVGVALISGVTGDVVPHAIEEEWTLGKDTTALAQGQKAYATTSGVITATATGTVTLAGFAMAAAATGAATANVKLSA